MEIRMATKSRSSATRKPSTGAGRTSAGTAKKKPAANPFKKTADAIKQSQQQAEQFTKQAQKQAADATKDAFGYGSQFLQANEWMRSSNEAAQNLFSQAFQGIPGLNGSAANYGVDHQSFSRAAETANRSVNELLTMGNEQLQTISETNSAIANAAKELSQEVVQSANTMFNDQIELSKAIFQCRNVDDVLHLQSKASQAALDNFFAESQRFSELTFKYAAEIAEPIQQSFAQAGSRLSKLTNAA
jgi:hypothetical protein